MRLSFGSEIIWNYRRILSMRCDWNLAETQLGVVLEYFRSDAIGVWLIQILDLP